MMKSNLLNYKFLQNLTLSLLLFLSVLTPTLGSLVPRADARVLGDPCAISSQASNNSVFLFGNLDPALHYKVILLSQSNPTNSLTSNILTGNNQIAFAIPQGVTNGIYILRLYGYETRQGAEGAGPNGGGFNLDFCFTNPPFTLSGRNPPVTPPPNAEECDASTTGFTVTSPQTSYRANRPIAVNGNIPNCNDQVRISATNSEGEGSFTPALADVQNNLAIAQLEFSAPGTWTINALNDDDEKIFSNDLVLNVIGEVPEFTEIDDFTYPPGESISFKVISCPAPLELTLNGERINEEIGLTAANREGSTVSITIPEDLLDEEGEYEIVAFCNGVDSAPMTITIDEDEAEIEPQKCPVCPDSHRTFNRALGLCCNNTRCVGSVEDGNLLEPTEDACQGDIQVCNPGRGCAELPPPGAPPCLESNDDGSCATVGFGDTALGIFLPTTAADFIRTLLGLLLSVAGMVAVALIVRSGYQYMTSRGNPDAVQEARDRLTSAIVGLLFIIFSLVILQVIGVDILQLPGFGN